MGKDTSKMENRKIILKSPNSNTNSERSVSYDSRSIEFPTEDHGLKFGGSKAVVVDVADNSPLKGEVFIGMIAAACRIPDGRDLTNIPGYLLTAILDQTQKIENRLVHFVHPNEYVEEEP